MFDRIRKVFQRAPGARAGHPDREPEASPSQLHHGPVSEWAASRGMTISGASIGHAAQMHGKIAGRPWRMELGKPSRDYIKGEELRARAELGVFDDVCAMIISRPLKDVLERRAYGMITDSLQTTADPKLPEEMRWLAMFDEVGWEGVPEPFWERYAVLADKREHALAWVDDVLVRKLMEWPQPAPGPEVPFLIVLMRGKCYLRMQYQPALMTTLEHATDIFTAACEGAVGAFGERE